MKKSSSTKKAAIAKEESSSEAMTSTENSGSEIEYSDNQLEQVEELMEDVSISDTTSTSEENNAAESVSSGEDNAAESVSNEEESEETQSGSEEECDEETQRTIFIKDIGYDVTEEDMKEQLQRLGEIVRVTIPMTHDQRRNKGFAYVEFKRLGDAQKALKLDGSELLGRKIAVFQAKPKTNRQIFTLFVKNLSYSTNKEDLKKHFEKYGKVFNVSLPTDSENTERNKGFCFVEFTDRDAIEAALKAKHTLNDRTLYINEGNKNEERNNKRSSDRLYGRKKNTEEDSEESDSRNGKKFNRNDRSSRDGGRDFKREGSGRFDRKRGEESNRNGRDFKREGSGRFDRKRDEESNRNGRDFKREGSGRFDRKRNEEFNGENKRNFKGKFEKNGKFESKDKKFSGKKSFDKSKKSNNKIVFDNSD